MKIKKDTNNAIALIEAAVLEAREEAKEANTRAHDIEVTAQAKIATAEKLVTEAQATLVRERKEADRLKEEIADLRKQITTD